MTLRRLLFMVTALALSCATTDAARADTVTLEDALYGSGDCAPAIETGENSLLPAGGTGRDSTSPPGATASLSAATAKLHYAFWTNQWGADNTVGLGAIDLGGRAGDLQEPQHPCWFLEGEVAPFLDDHHHGEVQAYTDLSDVSWGDGSKDWDDSAGLVRVLNLYHAHAGDRGSLVVVPLPASVLMGLAGLGLVVALRRRRLRT